MTITQFNVSPVLSPARLVAASNQSGTYYNGQLNNGVGATFTYATGALTIDSVTVNVGDRVVFVEQSSANQNGIYICTTAGATGVAAVLERTDDFQCIEQVLLGSYISVSAGSAHAGASYTVVEPKPARFGIDSLNFNAEITSGLGTAATKAASDDAQPIVASVDGATTVDAIATFADTSGTIQNSAYSITNDLLIQPAISSLTAHAGGGKASALQLTKALNTVTTVATDGDSVKLPPSAVGLQILVNNTSDTHAMQVFGSGTDTINLINTATGISQLPDTSIVYTCTTLGNWITSSVSTNFPTPTLIPYATGLTAHAGGGKASALQLTAKINAITTVATNGDSVKLPAAIAGLQVLVENLTDNNYMQVFGNGTDTINLGDTAVGIPQLPDNSILYTCTTTGNWHTSVISTNYPVPTLFPSATGITAHAGGGQASATQLVAKINAVTTVATSGDSVKLPPSVVGLQVLVDNLNDNNAIQVFGNGTDTINLIATGTGVPQLADSSILYVCTTLGNWHTSVISSNLPTNQTATLIATVPITAAQFNGMYAAPKLLVAAPGANQLLVLDKLELLMTYVSANYAAGGVVAVQYDSTALGAGVIASTTLSAATFQAAASTGFVFNTGVVPQTFSTCVNKGLYLSNVTGAFTTGDSTFVAKVYYRIVPTA